MGVSIFSLLLIFVLRILDVSLAVMRLLAITRGRKRLAWILAFCGSWVFLFTMRMVVADMSNWLNLVVYALGFATGTAMGTWLEGKFGPGYGHVRVISSRWSASIFEVLTSAGFPVVQLSGRGKDGTVGILMCSIPRRQVPRLKSLVEQTDPSAFVTVTNVRLRTALKG